MENNFANRLQKAMQIRNIKASELSEKSSVPKSAISQYLSGMYEAKQKTIYKLATALSVSPSWLIGMDVPMDKTTDGLESKLIKLNKYMEQNNINSLDLIPIYNNIDINNKNWKKQNISGYTPLDSKIQGCNNDSEYFYYLAAHDYLNKTIEKGSYILIEDTQNVEINDIIIYSIDSKIEIGLFTLNLMKESNIIIIGKYIK